MKLENAPGAEELRRQGNLKKHHSVDKKKSEGTLPEELDEKFVFTTFVEGDISKRLRLYFEAPKELAELFRSGTPKLSSTALRRIFQAFASFARRLQRDPQYWPKALEKFGDFYVEHVVRQVGRGVIPPLLQNFFDKHRKVALKNSEEMIGLFNYLKYLLCYYGDREERKS